jgi:hypothetical protein
MAPPIRRGKRPAQTGIGSPLFGYSSFRFKTAVPSLCAKPKIDILAVVQLLLNIDVHALENLGYEDRGEVVVSGRYFPKKIPGFIFTFLKRETH